MCNACGFGCCAFDAFDRCGCELCSNPKCWPVDEDDYLDENDSGECQRCHGWWGYVVIGPSGELGSRYTCDCGQEQRYAGSTP